MRVTRTYIRIHRSGRLRNGGSEKEQGRAWIERPDNERGGIANEDLWTKLSDEGFWDGDTVGVCSLVLAFWRSESPLLVLIICMEMEQRKTHRLWRARERETHGLWSLNVLD